MYEIILYGMYQKSKANDFLSVYISKFCSRPWKYLNTGLKKKIFNKIILAYVT